MKKFFLSMLVSLIGIALSLLLIELAFRLLQSPDKRWNDRPFAYFKPEASATLQDYQYTEKKAPGTFRIAIVGDSYTFAPYMQFTDAFPKVLERMLNLNATPQKVEVINYGVPAYSTTHEIQSVETALKQEADLVLLQITLNDPELKPYRPIGITDFNRFGELKVGDTTQKIFSYWHSLAYAATRLHNTKTYNEYIAYFFELFENPRSFGKFKSSLQQISKLCNDKGVKLAGLIFPLFGVPLDQKYPFTPLHEKVAAELAQLNVPYLDLFSIYLGIPIDRLQVIPGVDRHPNEIAHRMAAERIYQYLEQQKLIPEWALIKFLYSDRTRIIDAPKYEPPVTVQGDKK